ncbi:hypothetical protein SETIT_3G169100v2 [Setaria italica]|uniref:Uncharacterized protein n=1 Tax=Setaria italica TaxID=4555 RepID=A0A368QFZ5_SETIT|nr:hypothetical protein SETIT_3G169100v2 [Setaria italica]
MVGLSRRLELLGAARMAAPAHAHACRLAKCKGTPCHFLALTMVTRRANNSELVARAAKVGWYLARALDRLRHCGIRFRPWFRVIGLAAWERAAVARKPIRVKMRKLAVAYAPEI